MPWEKSFNEETALDNAMQVFWAKGYEPTSIADLLEKTGLNRGSFYNAFGNKNQLFFKALSMYDLRRRATLAKYEALDNPKEAIIGFLDFIVGSTVSDCDHKGCFLFNTALEITSHDEQVSDIVTSGVKQTEAFFRRCIEVGQTRGDIPTTIDPKSTAKSLLALVVAIRVLGRGVYQKSALNSIAEQGKQLIN